MSWRFCSILLTALLLSSPATAADKLKVRGGTVAPEGTPWEQQMKHSKKHMRKASDGRIKMKVYFGGQKGDEKSLVRQVKEPALFSVSIPKSVVELSVASGRCSLGAQLELTPQTDYHPERR